MREQERWIFRFLISACVLLASFVTTSAMAMTQKQPAKRITLVGASIGEAWHFDQLDERLKLSGYDFKYVGNNDFDKERLIEKLVGERDKPDVVMIKECSSYFPGDAAKYQAKIRSWVRTLRAAGIQPVLVTVAPVEAPGLVQRTKNLAKKMLGKPIWPEQVAAFNDWLRVYAVEERLPLFDLEAVLRISPEQRFLRQEFGVGDYVHLNAAAYRKIDSEFAQFLSRLGAAR